MKIAIEGCAHGELEKIYDTISFIENQENFKVDLLLCCGDFQATRNMNDLNCMAIPKKYHDICTFYKYYSGEKVAPILTIFIGGNHEASNYLQELPYGGWVAPNIYYMGYAGVVNVNGIRIGGISGIYKGFDFYKGHFEFPPYDNSTMRSVYHVRQADVFRMKQLSRPMTIMLSHDWPRGSYNYGNAEQLMKFKPHFRDEINANKLGSPALEDLLKHIKPDYWFAAHLHCKFSSIIPHDATDKTTKFLALDKCLPKRRFLQLLNIEADGQDLKLSYDEEWLAVLKSTNHLINAKNTVTYMPGKGSPYRWNYVPTDAEREEIRSKFPDLTIPRNFCRTAETYDPKQMNSEQPNALLNPQSVKFCELLQIDDPLSLAMLMAGHELNTSECLPEDTSITSNEANDSAGERQILTKSQLCLPPPKTKDDESLNPDEEVLLDDDDDIVDQSIVSDLSTNTTSSTVLDSGTETDEKTHSQTELISVGLKDLNKCGALLLDTCDLQTSKSATKFKRRNMAMYTPDND